MISFFIFSGTCFAAEFSPPFSVDAKSIILINIDSGVTVYEKNADMMQPPASLTKIMTAMLLLERAEDLDSEIIKAPRYIYDEFAGLSVSTADIRAGEEVTPRQLLYAMMLQSANEAASITADWLSGGDISAFCDNMNAKAKALGCQNTQFTNPHGLYAPEHYSTARDIATITIEAMKLPMFMEAATATRFTIPKNNIHAQERILVTTAFMQDKTTKYYKSYIKGIKTGTLPEAGHNYVSLAVQGSESYLLVVMGAEQGVNAAGEPLTNRPAFDITADIYNWAYNTFKVSPVLSLDVPVQQLPVKYCKETDSLLLYPTSGLYSIMPIEGEDTTLRRIYDLPEFIEAPIQKGTVIGTLTVMRGDTNLGTVDLAAGQEVLRNTMLYTTEKVFEVARTPFFKVAMSLIGLLILIYFILTFLSVRRYNRQKRSQVKKHIKRRMQ